MPGKTHIINFSYSTNHIASHRYSMLRFYPRIGFT